jgi:hypothetical protein
MSDGVGKIIEGFQETLPIFCETVLFNGHRNGDEWVVSNLENDRSAGEGSCYVNLRTGCYYDFNPAVDNQKGGPLDLWKSLFGVEQTHEALIGMQKWIKTGVLPGFGVCINPRVRHLPTEEEERDALLIANDDLEKKWLHAIRVFRSWIAHADLLAERGWKERPGQTTYFNDKKATEIDWRSEARKAHLRHWEAIRTLKSLFHEHRWQTISANSLANKEDIAQLLASYRGLSPGIFEYLLEGGNLALIKSDRPAREELQIAFPVCREAEFLYGPSANCFKPHSNALDALEALSRPETRTEFLGLHLRWFKGGFGEGGAWCYYPKGLCIAPLIVGDLKKAVIVLLAESAWDAFAFADIYRLHCSTRPWAILATRGSANSVLQLRKVRVREDAMLFAILQNDAANERWRQGIPLEISSRVREVIPPAAIKDFNDWARTTNVSEIKATLRNDNG